MARTAGTWGTAIPRKDSHGKIVGYQARYPHPLIPGKRVSKNFRSKGEALAWLDREHRLVDDHRRGERMWTPPKQREQERKKEEQSKAIIFAEYADRWMRSYPLRHHITDASQKKVEEQTAHLLQAPFASKLLCTITTEDIISWIHSEETKGQHYALGNACARLRAIMRDAVEEGVIEQNPCPKAMPKAPKASKQSQIPPATREELEAIYNAMPKAYRTAPYIAALFGMRIGEVCALQHQDIDLQHHVLHIRHSVDTVGAHGIKTTKTDSSTADKHIDEKTVPILEEALSQTPDVPAQFIFPKRNSNRPLLQQDMRKLFDAAKNAAGRPDLRFHSLKATYVTAAYRTVGVSPKEVQEASRHSDAKTNLVYQRTAASSEATINHSVAQQLLPVKRTRETIEREIHEAEARLAQLKKELAALND